MNGIKFKTIFESYFPLHLAYDWDNVGMQIGTINKEINSILLSLDLSMEVIDEAILHDANLIVVHHPVLFHSIKSIDTTTYLGRMIEKLIQHNITVYVAHTNFDVSNYGMNLMLANMLHLKNQKIIDLTTETEGLGRYGDLPKKMPITTFIDQLKAAFNLDKVRLIGEKDKDIKTVAIAGGSGSSLIDKVMELDVDVYVTGDISYHHALDAKNLGLTIIDVGHNIEKFSLEPLQLFLQEKGIDVPVLISRVNTNPYQFL